MNEWVGPIVLAFGTKSTHLGRCGPESAKHGPNWADSGPNSANLDHLRLGMSQIWLELDPNLPAVGNTWPGIDQIRPEIIQVWHEFRQFWTPSTAPHGKLEASFLLRTSRRKAAEVPQGRMMMREDPPLELVESRSAEVRTARTQREQELSTVRARRK